MYEIVETHLSNDFSLRAFAHAALIDLFIELGNYSLAEEYTMRLLSLFDARQDSLSQEERNWHASTVMDLGLVQAGQGGRDEEALKTFEKARKLVEKNRGRGHRQYAVAVSKIATHLFNMERYEEAGAYIEEAIDLWDAVGTEDYYYVSVAALYIGYCLYRDDLPTADSVLRSQWDVISRTMGDDHLFADLLDTRAVSILTVEDSLDRAIDLAQHVIQRCRDGSQFPSMRLMNGLQQLGIVAVAAGRTDLLASSVTDLSRTRHDYLMSVFRYASERQKLAFIKKYPPVASRLFAGVIRNPHNSTSQAAIEMVLRGKGLGFDAMAAEQTAAQCAHDPLLDSLLVEHRQVSGRIAGLVFSAKGADKGEMLAGLYARKGDLEAQISSACSNLKFFDALEHVTSTAVAAPLPQGSRLVEYVLYEDYDFSRVFRVWEIDSSYAAIVLAPDGSHSIIDLGKAATLDSLVEEYHTVMADALLRQWTDRGKAAMDRYMEVSAALYECIIAPLQSALEGAHNVYVSADGMLNLLPFETLTEDGERYLIEDYQFVYLTSGRDLLKEEYETDSREAIVMADPDYSIDPSALPLFAEESQSMFAARGNTETPECLASMVSSLPLTRKEGSTVAELLAEAGNLDISYLVSGEAREGALKSLQQAPRVLHIATHGYFCPEADRDALSNPLLRSGLVLAGANRTIGHFDEDRPDSEEDGILTALEASGLNLLGTDLVVLSACQTGIGEVQSGEGVFGLRRAFQHAGARSLITSMFAVPDESTVTLMKRFYENWLSGESKAAALRNASLSVLKERRENHESTHPLFWGGFILVGDPN